MDISKLKNYIKQNRPEIEIVASIFGFGFAVYDSVKSTVELETKKRELREEEVELSKKEEILMNVKAYARPTIVFSISTFMALDSHNENLKRAIGPTTAWLITDKAYREFGDKVKEVVGAKKEEEIRAAIGQDRIEANRIEQNVVIETGHGNELFYDCVTGRYFLCSKNWVDKCVNEFNLNLLNERELAYNEFYSLLGLSECLAGDLLGCHIAFNMLKLNYSYGEVNGQVCTFIDYEAVPLTDVHEY